MRDGEELQRSRDTRQLIYPLFRFTLKEEIARRKKMKLQFEETELWFLLFNIASASAQFQKRRLKSGDIRPRNVLIDDKGDIVIVNVYTFPEETTNYYKALQLRKVLTWVPCSAISARVTGRTLDAQ